MGAVGLDGLQTRGSLLDARYRAGGWGPLAPGEAWPPPAGRHPTATVCGRLHHLRRLGTGRADHRPRGFHCAAEGPLGRGGIHVALPSPAFIAPGSTRCGLCCRRAHCGGTCNTGVTFQNDVTTFTAAPPAPAPPASQSRVIVIPETPGPEGVSPPPPQEAAVEPVPVYAGIVVVRPPRKDKAPARPAVRASVQPTPPPPSPPPPSHRGGHAGAASEESQGPGGNRDLRRVIKDVQNANPAKAIWTSTPGRRGFPTRISRTTGCICICNRTAGSNLLNRSK